MAENAENPVTPTVLIGATGTTPGSDVGTVDPPTVRSLIQVQLGATANAPDATLLARANHTGAQAISTVTGLQTALNGKVDTVYGRGGAVVAATGDYNADQISETASNKVLTAAERTKLAGVATGATANASDALLRDRTTHTGVQATSTITGLDAALAARAFLDSPAFIGTPTAPTPSTADNSGRIATTAMVQAVMATVSGGTEYLGNWNASTNTPTLSNGSGVGNPGGFYVVSVAGSTTIDGINTWTVGDWIISDNVGWKKIDQTDAVSSVFGRSGTVVSSIGDYNADQITETATGKIMTAAERTKLAGVATGATANSTDAQLRDRTTHTGVQAISTVTGLQTALDSKTTTVFGRTGAVVAVAGDYNADQVTETAGGKIMTAAERTKLLGVEAGATADQTAAEIETAYNAQVALVTQAIAEAGTSTTVARWTPERVKQAIVALTPAGSGASGSNLNSNANLGTPAVALSTTEAQIGAVTLTPSVTGAKILVLAAVYLNKDNNTTVRNATLRLRRGTTNGSTQVGGDLVSRHVAGTNSGLTAYGGPTTLAYIDTAPSTAALTYTVRGLVDTGASTATAFHMAAVELTGLSIPTLPTMVGATNTLADYAVVYDASAGINTKVLLSDLGLGGSGALADGDKGDITVASSGAVWTIDANAVTYAKMQAVAADRMLGSVAGGAVSEIPVTAAGRALIDDADATAQRTTLGLGTAATQASTAFQTADATLTALGGLNATAGLVEQTGADTFTKRAMGVAAGTDVLTRADGDSRFAAASHTHSQANITNLTTDLAALTAVDATKAPLASPALTGTPTAPTAASTTNTTQLATTAFVQQELGAAPNHSFKTVAVSGQSDVAADAQADTLTFAAGANVAITTNAATDTVSIAATGLALTTHTHAESDVTNLVTDLAAKAALASPTFTGTPAAPTAAATTNTTQLATTAFVQQELQAAPNFGFKTIAVAGQSDVVADVQADTLTFVAGTNMTLTTSAAGDSVTFAATGGGGSSDSEGITYLAPYTGGVSRTVEAKLAEMEVSANDFSGTPTQKILAAAAACVNTNKTLVIPDGTWVCSQLDLLNIRNIRCEGVIVSTIVSADVYAVRIGTTGASQNDATRCDISLIVVHQNNVNTGLSGTQGIRIHGMSLSQLTLRAESFDTGVAIVPQDSTEYFSGNTVRKLFTYGCQTGLSIAPISTGFANENQFYGISINPGNTNLGGTVRGIYLNGTPADNGPDNNFFYTPQLEGCPVPIAITKGVSNFFLWPRYEAAGNIVLGDNTDTSSCGENVFYGGYGQSGHHFPQVTYQCQSPNYVGGRQGLVWRNIWSCSYYDWTIDGTTYYSSKFYGPSQAKSFTNVTLNSTNKSWKFGSGQAGWVYFPVNTGDVLRIYISRLSAGGILVNLHACDANKADLSAISAGALPYIGTSYTSAGGTSGTGASKEIGEGTFETGYAVSINRSEVKYLGVQMYDTTPEYTSMSVDKLMTDRCHYGPAEPSGDNTFLAPYAGSVSRTTQAKLAEFISVKDWGATGNGTTNDLSALNAATTAALLTGRTIYFPPGIYRITGQWLIGNTVMGTNFDSVITDDYTIANSDDVTQINLSKAHVAPSIIGASGAVIWGDFTPSTTTPILYYGVEFSQGSGGVYNTPVTIEGISIVGKPGYTAGVATDPGGNASITGTKQIGLACSRGARVVRNLSIRACQVGLFSQGAYWARYDTIVTWRCEVGFRLKNANATASDNLLIWYGDKGVVYDGDTAEIRGIHTQYVTEDLIIQSAVGSRFGPGYFEDLSAVSGTGKYALTLGAASGGNTVNYNTFEGIKIGNVRPGKGGLRYWAALKNTFIGMQQAGHTLAYDSISGGAQFASDYAFPITQMPILSSRLKGTIEGVGFSSEFVEVRSGWLDTMVPGGVGILPGQQLLFAYTMTGMTHGQYIGVMPRTTPAAGITFYAQAVADAIYVWVNNNSNILVNETWNLTFFSYKIPATVYSGASGPFPGNKGTQPAGITADKGDSGATYTLSHPSSQVQRAGTTFTANRTVTLPTLTVTDFGVRYTFLRDAATPGAFTWNIGGVGTMPNSAKAQLTVEWDTNTSTWRQISYGTLV